MNLLQSIGTAYEINKAQSGLTLRLFLKRNFLIAHVNFHLPACCMNIDEVTAQLQAPLVLRRRKHCMIDMVGLVP